MILETVEACDKQLAELHELESKTKTFKTKQKLAAKRDATLDRRLELEPRKGVSIYAKTEEVQELAAV